MNGWSLSTDHAASSYGQPVLVAPDGLAFGPADLLSGAQVAEALGTTQGYVRVMINRGVLPGRQIGKTWAVPAAAVIERLARREANP